MGTKNNIPRLFGEGPLEKTKKTLRKSKKTRENPKNKKRKKKRNNIPRLFGEGPLEKTKQTLRKPKKKPREKQKKQYSKTLWGRPRSPRLLKYCFFFGFLVFSMFFWFSILILRLWEGPDPQDFWNMFFLFFLDVFLAFHFKSCT